MIRMGNGRLGGFLETRRKVKSSPESQEALEIMAVGFACWVVAVAALVFLVLVVDS